MKKYLFSTLLLSSLPLAISAIHNHAELITMELTPTTLPTIPDTTPTGLTEEAALTTPIPELPALDVSTESNKWIKTKPEETLGAHSIEDEPVEEELVKEFNFTTSIGDDPEESDETKNEDSEIGLEAPEMDIE